MQWTTIPAPLLVVDAALRLVEASEAAIRLFRPRQGASFLELLDPGSVDKARRLLAPEHIEATHGIELNLVSANGRTLLADVYPRWHPDGLGWLFCSIKNAELERIEQRVGRMTNALKEEAASAQTLLPFPARRQHDEAAELRSRIDVALELLEMLRPDLIELAKDDFLNVIVSQLRPGPHLAP